MPAENQRLTFISYSRADKEFALQLASELRSSGFKIWLDQLDIPTGARWDDEVERALINCDIFMIILTRNSIASNNVKDEIGYAIDSNKRILPILLENVNVPFRLRRFQYVDFSAKSYEEGIDTAKQLLRMLINEPSVPRKFYTDKAVGSPSAPPANTQPGKKLSLPTIGLLAGITVLSITCLAAFWVIGPNLQELLSEKKGTLVTEAPQSNIIVAATTAAVPTALPPPSEFPMATTQPPPTITLTHTPVQTFTVTPFSPAEPGEFLNFYFETIIYQRDFELGWSLLSDAFKTNNNPTGYEDWKNTWVKVAEWRRPTWSVEYATTTKAFVSTPEIWFRSSSWYSLTNREYCIVRDESRNTWIIESKVVCGR